MFPEAASSDNRFGTLRYDLLSPVYLRKSKERLDVPPGGAQILSGLQSQGQFRFLSSKVKDVLKGWEDPKTGRVKLRRWTVDKRTRERTLSYKRVEELRKKRAETRKK